MNSVCLSGRLTRDIELKQTQNNIAVCSFTIAVDRPMVKDKTDFVDCVAWRQSADFASKYFFKGDPIELTGVLTTRSYEDKNGVKRKAVEVVCEHISFPKQKASASSGAGNSKNNTFDVPAFGDFTDASDEEIPF